MAGATGTKERTHEVLHIIRRIFAQGSLILEVAQKLLNLVNIDTTQRYRLEAFIVLVLLIILLNIDTQRICVYTRLFIHPHEAGVTEVLAGLMFETVDSILCDIQYDHVDRTTYLNIGVNDLTCLRIARYKVKVMFNIQYFIAIQVVGKHVLIVSGNHSQQSRFIVT